jgi:hypothetical protein
VVKLNPLQKFLQRNALGYPWFRRSVIFQAISPYKNVVFYQAITRPYQVTSTANARPQNWFIWLNGTPALLGDAGAAVSIVVVGLVTGLAAGLAVGPATGLAIGLAAGLDAIGIAAGLDAIGIGVMLVLSGAIVVGALVVSEGTSTHNGMLVSNEYIRSGRSFIAGLSKRNAQLTDVTFASIRLAPFIGANSSVEDIEQLVISTNDFCTMERMYVCWVLMRWQEQARKDNNNNNNNNNNKYSHPD